ncbi:MAG: N-acetylmuramic acid 6-phosphate etherase [Planctomycetota bacterium]|jgi:N-acetylmuramic acid 6-phosphate etherase|nr:N-acetylmuramic acid 6-phosphate etherase [Planctomycetota bacterium]
MSYQDLITESRNKSTADLDECTSIEMIKLMQREDAEVLRAVKRVRNQMAAAVDEISVRLRRGGRLFYVGAGTSGRLGVLDAAECPPTYGTDPEMVQGIIAGGIPALTRSIEGAEDRPDIGRKKIREKQVIENDVVFGITASGTAPFVLAALQEAASRRAFTILLCFNPEVDDSVANLIFSPVVGPEVVTGSTRMKAGTATKLILNTISTAVMVRLGKVYGNLMVDLQVKNKKLEDRACRIVMALTGAGRKEAERLIRRADGDTKVAIVMGVNGTTPSKARKLLGDNDGILRKVIGQV